MYTQLMLYMFYYDVCFLIFKCSIILRVKIAVVNTFQTFKFRDRFTENCHNFMYEWTKKAVTTVFRLTLIMCFQLLTLNYTNKKSQPHTHSPLGCICSPNLWPLAWANRSSSGPLNGALLWQGTVGIAGREAWQFL